MAMGCSIKIHKPPTEEISTIQRGGEGKSLKNVINLYRMSKEGRGGGGLLISCMEGVDLFWNRRYSLYHHFILYS